MRREVCALCDRVQECKVHKLLAKVGYLRIVRSYRKKQHENDEEYEFAPDDRISIQPGYADADADPRSHLYCAEERHGAEYRKCEEDRAAAE